MSAVTARPRSQQRLFQQIRERRLNDQIGRVSLSFLLIIVAAVYLYAPFQAFSWMQQPFIGTFLEYPLSANVAISEPFFDRGPTQGTPNSLRQDDIILSIDGHSVVTSDEFYTILSTHDIGDIVPLDVLASNGSEREIRVIVQEMPLDIGLSLFGIPYLVGMVYMAIGLWVYRNRRDQALGRSFLMLCSGIALLMVTTFDFWSTHNFIRLWTGILPLIGGILASFALIFPDEPAMISRRPAIRLIPFAPALILMIGVQLLLNSERDILASLWEMQYLFVGITIVFFIGMTFARAIFALSPSVREQSRVVLAGTAFAFTPFIIDLAFQIADIQIAWILLGTVIFPLTIAYSIIQYSVLDTGRVLTFGVTYTIMAGVVMVGFGLFVAGVNTLFANAINLISPTAIGLMAFLLVLVFQPVRKWLQDHVDNFFFRSREEHQARLTTFRHDLTLANGLTEVVRLVKQQIRETLIPTHIYVFLRDTQSNTFVAAGEGNRPDTDIRFETTSGLVNALSATRDLIFLELNKPLPPVLAEDHAQLAVLRTPILVALQGQDRLAGWVAIGAKRSGDIYSIHDLRFIQAVTEQASLAVERAQVLSDMERRVRELDVLGQVSQAVNFTTDPDVLMELIYTQTSKLIDTTNFYIIMHRKETRGLYYSFFLESDERFEDKEDQYWSDEIGLGSEIIRVGRPIRTENYSAECAQRGVRPLSTGNQGHQAWMGVPLNAAADTLGTMVVASYIPGILFSEEQLKVFWAIADQAATALDKARLFTETERRAKQLATLNDISKEISSTLDLENLLERIMSSAVEILNAEAGTLYLADGDELEFRVIWGGEQELVGKRMPIDKGIAGQAATTKEPAVSNNVLQDGRWFSEVDRETAFQTSALLAVPLIIHDESIGVIQIINKKDGTNFDNDDIALLTTFASQAAIALDNARLYEATDAELAARVDELQNLQRIDRELNRTLDFDRVVKITIDWAKNITGASATALAMLSPDETGAQLLAANGYTEEFMEKHGDNPIPLGKGVVGRVLRNGKAEFIHDASTDPDYIISTDPPSIALIAVPILRANKPIGVLVLESHVEDLFEDKDYAFAQRLVEHAAVAIENARLLREVEDANRDKTDFISFVAHELNNPMTSIRGYTDLLKGGSLGEVSDMQVQFLGTIRSNVDRMTRLVKDLQDSARIDNNQLRLDRKSTSVQSIVDETVRGMQGMINEKEQELVFDISESLPEIYADHTRMVQVMTNLISNAHKYTPDEGKLIVGARLETFIDEDISESQEMVHFWIKDTGIGMSDEDLEQLFTKFFRAERGKEMAQGTGLGLTITKSLVEQHGGLIWVESVEAEGTTFHFTIPPYDEALQHKEADQAAE